MSRKSMKVSNEIYSINIFQWERGETILNHSQTFVLLVFVSKFLLFMYLESKLMEQKFFVSYETMDLHHMESIQTTMANP
jgi:hypothetical protein